MNTPSDSVILCKRTRRLLRSIKPRLGYDPNFKAMTSLDQHLYRNKVLVTRWTYNARFHNRLVSFMAGESNA